MRKVFFSQFFQLLLPQPLLVRAAYIMRSNTRQINKLPLAMEVGALTDQSCSTPRTRLVFPYDAADRFGCDTY